MEMKEKLVCFQLISSISCRLSWHMRKEQVLLALFVDQSAKGLTCTFGGMLPLKLLFYLPNFDLIKLRYYEIENLKGGFEI